MFAQTSMCYGQNIHIQVDDDLKPINAHVTTL